ncbi:MAG: peptidylprolyl isomerase [Bacilli bacterium]|nr:peptidylprolyl isomerase [Bacilli bacterium]
MKKKLLLSLACLLLLAGCKDVKLENGENAVVTFTEGGISSQELYSELKTLYGAETITNLIDKYLLSKKYEETQEEKTYINQYVKQLKSTAKEAGTDLETYISLYYGLKDEPSLREYLKLTYRRNKYAEEYAKENVNNKQVNDYYKSYVYGDIEASQILITVDVSENANENDKKKADAAALEKAKKIIDELKTGKDFATLAKQYSKDEATASNGGYLGKEVNDGDLPDEALSALRGLNNGSYTLSPIKSSYGYHILYKTNQSEKPELNDELIDTIKTKIGEETAQTSGYVNTAMKSLREQNDMKFIDTDLEKQFNKSN